MYPPLPQHTRFLEIALNKADKKNAHASSENRTYEARELEGLQL